MTLASAPSWGAENTLPHPLHLNDALRIAREQRAEIRAAGARAEAARQRPAIVSALEDPILAPSIDHKPVDEMMETDRSITLEQSFPLSRIRGHRRDAARAEADRLRSEVDRTGIVVGLDAARSFFMLNEKRRMQAIVQRQIELAAQVVKSAAARYGAGSSAQADVLRAEIEQARLQARLQSLRAETAAAEAMLNTSLGRDVGLPVPVLATDEVLDPALPLPSVEVVQATALDQRPEISGSEAEIRRAEADVKVMKSMYLPMAMVRTGVAETMTAGRGYMLMVGVSLPIWFNRLNAGVDEARAMETMARADQQAMRRMISGEAAAALEGVRGAQARYRALTGDVLPRAERAIAPSLSAYASGQLSLTGVLEAIKALWAVQEEAVMAETELGLAWVRLHAAMGKTGEGE
jgi:outer membrane protein TolC